MRSLQVVDQVVDDGKVDMDPSRVGWQFHESHLMDDSVTVDKNNKMT